MLIGSYVSLCMMLVECVLLILDGLSDEVVVVGLLKGIIVYMLLYCVW